MLSRKLLPTLAAWLTVTGLGLAQAPAPPLSAPPTDATPAPRFGTESIFGDAGPGFPEASGASDGRLWFDADYLLWWFRKAPIPVPLLTSGNPADAVPGALGQPGTEVVIGGTSVGLQAHSGARFSVGYGLDDGWGLEAGYFFLASRTVTRTASSSGAAGTGVLAAPFFDSVTGAENSDEQSGPGLPGTTTLALDSRLQSAEINASYNWSRSPMLRLDVIGGFRYLNLREDLAFSNVGAVTNAALAAPIFGTTPFVGEVNDTLDRFSTRNEFFGGQCGVRADLELGRFFAVVSGKLALGGMQESLSINGTTATNATGNFTTATAPTSAAGGIFAQPTNIGHYRHDEFEVMPELNLKVGYQLARWARVSIGYDLLYLNSVARPGNQIDRTINTNQFVDFTGLPLPAFTGAARPAFLGIQGSNFWAQGVSFGLEFSY